MFNKAHDTKHNEKKWMAKSTGHLLSIEIMDLC
jgi:hypothetical protein